MLVFYIAVLNLLHLSLFFKEDIFIALNGIQDTHLSLMQHCTNQSDVSTDFIVPRSLNT